MPTYELITIDTNGRMIEQGYPDLGAAMQAIRCGPPGIVSATINTLDDTGAVIRSYVDTEDKPS